MALHNGKGPRNAYGLPPLPHRLAPQSCLGICSLGGPVQCCQHCIALPTLQTPKPRLEQSGLSWPAPQPTPSAKQLWGRQFPPAVGLVAMASEEKKEERIPELHPERQARPPPPSSLPFSDVKVALCAARGPCHFLPHGHGREQRRSESPRGQEMSQGTPAWPRLPRVRAPDPPSHREGPPAAPLPAAALLPLCLRLCSSLHVGSPSSPFTSSPTGKRPPAFCTCLHPCVFMGL